MTHSSTLIPFITECLFAHKSHIFCSLLLEWYYPVLKEQSKSIFTVLRKFVYAALRS